MGHILLLLSYLLTYIYNILCRFLYVIWLCFIFHLLLLNHQILHSSELGWFKCHGWWKPENLSILEVTEGMMVRWMCGVLSRVKKPSLKLYNLLGFQSVADLGTECGWSRDRVWLISGQSVADLRTECGWSRDRVWLISGQSVADLGTECGWSPDRVWLIIGTECGWSPDRVWLISGSECGWSRDRVWLNLRTECGWSPDRVWLISGHECGWSRWQSVARVSGQSVARKLGTECGWSRDRVWLISGQSVADLGTECGWSRDRVWLISGQSRLRQFEHLEHKSADEWVSVCRNMEGWGVETEARIPGMNVWGRTRTYLVWNRNGPWTEI